MHSDKLFAVVLMCFGRDRFKGAIAWVLHTRSVIRNYSSYYSNWKQLFFVRQECALFRVLVSIRKALDLESTDGVVFYVT